MGKYFPAHAAPCGAPPVATHCCRGDLYRAWREIRLVAQNSSLDLDGGHQNGTSSGCASIPSVGGTA